MYILISPFLFFMLSSCLLFLLVYFSLSLLLPRMSFFLFISSLFSGFSSLFFWYLFFSLFNFLLLSLLLNVFLCHLLRYLVRHLPRISSFSASLYLHIFLSLLHHVNLTLSLLLSFFRTTRFALRPSTGILEDKRTPRLVKSRRLPPSPEDENRPSCRNVASSCVFQNTGRGVGIAQSVKQRAAGWTTEVRIPGRARCFSSP